MLPRRLVLSSSSDEDDEPHNQPHPRHHQESQPQPPLILSQSRNSVNPNPTTPNPSAELLEISDDEDFIDVSDNLSPPSPPTPNPNPNPNSPPPPPPPPPPSSGGCPISDILWGLGLGLKREWLDFCVRGLEQAVPGFRGLGVDAKAKLCFEKFLVSDMNRSGGGVLPENVDRLHLVDLPGPFVLQVDEIVNISNPLKGRYQKAPPGIKRCLKLSMTDGLQRVFGMEYRPIKDLDALAPAGLKVVICNVHIRHGLLILVPEAFEVLEGVVEELEAARQQLVDEVNKLPRGIRTRGGVVPPLRTRASLAAWPSNSAHVAGNTSNMTSEHTTPIRVHNQGSTYVALGTDADQRVGGEFPGVSSEESAIRNSSTSVIMDVDELPIPVSTESAIPNQSPQVVTGAEEAPYVVFSTVEEEVLVDTIPNSRANIAPNSSTDVASIAEEIDMELIPSRTDNPMSDTYPNDILNDEEIPLVDEFEHPLILSGNREIPFTYLASLSAKWTAMKKSVRSVKGIVKCFLTGVKRFEYKDRTFELQAYVDDGSLISEIVIHHDAIQKMIGHSPREVTAALSSSDPTTAQNIRETMRQFQSFLAKFEGKMLIEINEASPLPVALEMNQGCSESDAQLLLRRFRYERLHVEKNGDQFAGILG